MPIFNLARAMPMVRMKRSILSFCTAKTCSTPERTLDLRALARRVVSGIGRRGGFLRWMRLTKPFRFIIVGSPAYLARSGRPERPDDLRQHACVRLRRSNGALALWSLNDNGRVIEIAVSGPLIANDFPTVLGAAIEGVGLAQVPEPIAAGAVTAGKLVRVLGPFAPMGPGVFLYYPGHRQIMPKLRAFIDHVKNRPTQPTHARPGGQEAVFEKT